MPIALGVAVLAVLVIAGGIALAPFMGWVAKAALLLVLLTVILGWLSRIEQRFARWYDTTRVARWLAGPPTVTMVTLPLAPQEPTDQTDGIAETPLADRGLE